MAKLWIRFCFLATGFSAVIASQNGVPALLWTNTNSDFPTPIAGHTTRQAEFKTDYLQNNANKPGHTLVAFIQDKLSLEDIIDNADVYNEHSTGSKFANLKRLVETHKSVHLPAVFSPGETLEKLVQGFKGKVHHLEAPYNIKHVTIDSTVPNLVLVHLPKNDGKSFKKIDATIGSLTDNLKSLNLPFTAVYTGQKPSQVYEESGYTGRHLLANKEITTNYTVYNYTHCILAYQVVHLEVCMKTGKKCDIHSDTIFKYNFTGNVDDTGTKCENSTGKIVLTFPKQPHNLQSFKMEMIFGYDRFMFWNASIKLAYKIENGSATVDETSIMATEKVIYAPKRFSYHCYHPYPFKQKNSSTDAAVATLRIEGLQVQFGERRADMKFDRPNDCESFFSVPVLSGLFAGLILTSILAFGICMIINISTMDRFDDPKGKTITVNTAEG